jgi:hypothetical protein
VAYVRGDTDSKPKARAIPQVQHGQKRIALTTRKTKPDGSHEVTHKVEHSFDPIPHLRKMKPPPHQTFRSIGKDAAASRDTHAMIVHGGTAHRHGTSLADTIRQLRDYRMRSLIDRGAFAGNGRDERPAPDYSEDPGQAGLPFSGSAPPLMNPSFPNNLWRTPYEEEIDPMRRI